MLEQLFFRSDALACQLSAPLVDERRQYLAQCAAQGITRRTLRVKARLLVSITKHLRLAERPYGRIALPEIEKAANRWSIQNHPSSKSSCARLSRAQFINRALDWLRLLNRLRTIPKQVTVCDKMLAEFSSFMTMIEGSLQRPFSTVATPFDRSLSRCLRENGPLTRLLSPMWTRFSRRRRKIIIMQPLAPAGAGITLLIQMRALREDYLMPTTMESGPTRCSTRVLVKPASFIQPMQSAPV